MSSELLTFGAITVDPQKPRRLQPDESRTVISAMLGTGEEAEKALNFYQSYAELSKLIRMQESQGFGGRKMVEKVKTVLPVLGRRLVWATLAGVAGYIAYQNISSLISPEFLDKPSTGNVEVFLPAAIVSTYCAYRTFKGIGQIISGTGRAVAPKQALSSLDINS